MFIKKPNENMSTEFTSKQTNQLKQFSDMMKLHKLLDNCEKFKNELEELTNERTRCLEDQEKYREHLLAIEAEHKIAKMNKLDWQIKLEEVHNLAIDDKMENLRNICLVLGYHISSCQLVENNALKIMLQYRDICYVSYTTTAEGSYDVVEICPQHPNFIEIQTFLQKSQDLRGLLTCLIKFFDFAIQTKENSEKQ